MSNKKNNVHSSGPLGMLVRKGQVQKIDGSIDEHNTNDLSTKGSPYFKTTSGIEFTENELIYIDPNECEPWRYANRLRNELGNMDELVNSIRENQQLQPALIRIHSNPHGEKKYEVIFGRRRHLACLTLDIPFLAICKDIPNDQDAVLFQHDENKVRKNVSNYSDAVLYKGLLNDSIFKTEKELAHKINISPSSLSELLSLTRIPKDIIDSVEDPNNISKNMSLKILKIISEGEPEDIRILNKLADQIGKAITSPSKLMNAIKAEKSGQSKDCISKRVMESIQYISKEGTKLFSFKYDRRGLPTIVFHKNITEEINMENLCKFLKGLIEDKNGNSDIRIFN